MDYKPTDQELQARCRALEKEVAAYRAEREKLLESTHQYRLIADNTSDLVSMITFDADPRFIYISPSFRSVGYRSEALVGKPALPFVHADDRPRILKILEKAVQDKSGEAQSFVRKFECRIKMPDGAWKYLESVVTNIDQSALLLISRDVDIKKETELALQASEKAYRSIFENTGTATLIIEADTTIGMANSQFARLVGYSRAEIDGMKRWTEFVFPEDLDFMTAYHYERRKGKKDVPRAYEFRLLDRYGNVRWVHNTVAVIPGTGRSVASMYDLTDIRQAEAALRESEEKFRTITSNAYDAILMVSRGGGGDLQQPSCRIPLRILHR